MTVTDLASAIEALHADHAERIDEGVRFLHERLAGLPEAELRSATEVLCSLFYVDVQDRPDLQPSLERAVEALASVGPRIVSDLLELMRGSDMKSHFYLARTLELAANVFEREGERDKANEARTERDELMGAHAQPV